MSPFDLCLVIATLSFVFLGSWGIYWARCGLSPVRMTMGRALFVVAFLGLGLAGLVAAGNQANGLAPLGLLAGLLLVAMVWETPATSSSGS